MMPATIPKGTRERKRKRRELLARADALGWSQNELARRLGKNIGHTSRVLRGERDSAVIWADAETVIAEAEARQREQVPA